MRLGLLGCVGALILALIIFGGYFVGVPCVLGTDGVEKIIEIEMDDAERKMFQTSVDHVKDLVKAVKI